MKERNLKILVIFAVLSGIIINFQNCASQKNSLTPADLADQGDDGDTSRDIIDAINTGSIKFVQSKAEVTSDDTDLRALGICSQDQQNALLSWKVFDGDNNIIASGKSLCDRGGFEVVFEGVDSLPCDSALSLQAFFGAQSKTELLIDKKCQ